MPARETVFLHRERKDIYIIGDHRNLLFRIFHRRRKKYTTILKDTSK